MTNLLITIVKFKNDNVFLLQQFNGWGILMYCGVRVMKPLNGG